MICKALVILPIVMAVSASALPPPPAEIAACISSVKGNMKSPSSFVLKSYGGRGRVVSAEMVQKHLSLVDDGYRRKDGSVCVYRASIQFDGQNSYGALLRDSASCSVLVMEGRKPLVAREIYSRKGPWEDFDKSVTRCARPVSEIERE